MKKIISIFLTISIIITAFSAFTQTAFADSDSKRYIKLIYNLGITQGMGDSASTLTRGEFAEILVELLNAGDIVASYDKGSFLDVSEDRSDVGSIDLVYSCGIMVDVKGGKFRPDDRLTYAEACEGLVRLLGYKDMGDAKGYVSAALSLGVARNAVSLSEYITMGELCQMLYHSLNVRMARNRVTSDNVTIDLGEMGLLRDYLKITEDTGRVTAVKGMNLYGIPKDIGDTQVEISGEKYDTLEYFTQDHLGSSVNFWYRYDEDDKPVIIYAEYANASEEISFMYNDVKRAENSFLEYEIEKGKTKKIKLSSDVKILKNSVPISNVTSVDFSGKGIVKCVMENNACTTLILFEYKSFLVESTGTKIRFSYGADFVLDTRDDENEYIITNGKDYFDFSQIHVNDVLSVAHDDSTNVYFIMLSRKSETGEITEIVQKGDDYKYKINGTEYGIDDGFYNLTENGYENLSKVTAGLYTDFYIDWFGDICGMSYSRDYQYAYIKATGTLGGSFSDDYAMKLITKRLREFRIYNLARRVNLNGVSLEKETAYKEIKKFMNNCDDYNPPVMKFKENLKGEITDMITTVVKGYTTRADVLSKPLPRNKNEGYRFSISYKKFYTTNNADPDSSFYNDIHINTQAAETDLVCIKIPPNGNEEDFEVGVPYDLGIDTDWEYHDVIFYDLNEFYEPSFMLLFLAKDDSALSATGQTVIGVEDVSTVYKDGETVLKLSGYYNGVKTEYTVPEDDDKIYTMAKKLQKGDFVQVEANYKNEITAMKFYFTYNVESFDFDRLKSGGDMYEHYCNDGNGMKLILNRVKNANGSYIVFDGDPLTNKLTYCLDYQYPTGGYITMYDGESFSQIQMKNIEKNDVIFSVVGVGSTYFSTLIVLRDLDSSLIDSNILMP